MSWPAYSDNSVSSDVTSDYIDTVPVTAHRSLTSARLPVIPVPPMRTTAVHHTLQHESPAARPSETTDVSAVTLEEYEPTYPLDPLSSMTMAVPTLVLGPRPKATQTRIECQALV